MNCTDSMPNPFSYQPNSLYGMEPTASLQPAAPIYQSNQHPFVNQGLSYGPTPIGRFGMEQQGALDMHNPFVNVYHHPFQSVSLSAIQPYESCLPQSASMYSGPTDCSQYMASPARPRTSSSQAQVSTPANVPSQWSGSMLSVSLEHPFDVHTFFANSDGTISNLLATPYTPSNMPVGERGTKKRKSGEEPSSSYAGPSERDKRQCFGVVVNTNLEPLSTPDSSLTSSYSATQGTQNSPLEEVVTPPAQPSVHLRPRKNVDYLPETPSGSSPTDARRAVSAAARAQSITDHVMEIYRSYAKPKESPDSNKDQQLAGLPFIEGYEPVLPAFPELLGDELMMSGEEDEQDKEVREESSPGNGNQRKGGKRSPRAARGQDKVSNRVAARRHREMTKERLKNLEKLRSWLDDALQEYEKSNQVLQENFQQLQRENHKLQRIQPIPIQQSS